MGRWIRWGVAIGALSTLMMDAGAIAMRALGLLRGLPPVATGRWFGSMARGTFTHHDILESPPVRGEMPIAMATHYLIGCTLATGCVLLLRARARASGSLSTRMNIALAMAYGTSTTVIAWFVMFPAMGYGLFGRHAPPPMQLFPSSLVNHAVYGGGLALWTYVFRHRLAAAFDVPVHGSMSVLSARDRPLGR
ncbi:MAG TPA: DUF2938 family protein [Kofleriaceae bacterium]|nr:DUF2938 family protein [Kofleriaceae bacterium]